MRKSFLVFGAFILLSSQAFAWVDLSGKVDTLVMWESENSPVSFYIDNGAGQGLHCYIPAEPKKAHDRLYAMILALRISQQQAHFICHPNADALNDDPNVPAHRFHKVFVN
jgi:hypothetical protein